MLKIKVKVGSITHLSDARYCAGMGADYLGFPVSPPDGLSVETVREITDWVSGPQLVIEWNSSEAPVDPTRLVHDYNADFLQIGVQSLPFLKNIPPLVVRVTLADLPVCLPVLYRFADKISYLQMNTEVLEAAPELILKFAVLADVNGTDNMDAVSKWNVAGISLQGSAESSPGIKDYTTLSDILEKLEVG